MKRRLGNRSILARHAHGRRYDYGTEIRSGFDCGEKSGGGFACEHLGHGKILPKGKKFPRFAPVTVRIGEPLSPPVNGDRAGMEALTQRCTEVINEMHALGR